MMPGIGSDRGAVNGAAESADGAKQRSLDDDGDNQHEKSERCGAMMRQKNFADACKRQSSSSREDAKSNDDSGERFRFAVAIRMSGIRWTRGKSQPAPYHDRARGIERGFDAIGDKRVSISKNAGRNFDKRECNIDGKPDEREPRAGLQIARGNVTVRMSIHAEAND